MMHYFKVIIVSLLVLSLDFGLCQGQVLIPKTIGTITKQPEATKLPEKLQVPKGHNFAFLLYAWGNQQYKCVAAPQQQWLSYNVDAMLINDKNDIGQNFNPSFEVVHHNISSTPQSGGNYTWTSLLPTDNSQVIAKSVDFVNVTMSDIPWEITAATFRSESGRLKNVSYVLKVNTTGGLAPPTEQCGNQYIDGFILSVTYQAEYWFYEGVLPGTEPPPSPSSSSPPSAASSQPSSKQNDGYSTKAVGLGWIAIVSFVSVGVVLF